MHSLASSTSLRIAATFALTTLASLAAHADRLYVNVALATGADNGASWNDAFRGPEALQRALTNAAAGDEIWVARGSYSAAPNGLQSERFELVDAVALFGGFAGFESELSQRDVAANLTRLTAEIGGPQIGDNADTVLLARAVGPRTVLDGFTISDGVAHGAEAGGLICSQGAELVIRNCRFTNCRRAALSIHTSRPSSSSARSRATSRRATQAAQRRSSTTPPKSSSVRAASSTTTWAAAAAPC